MKTIREWLDTLSEPHRSKAIFNAENDPYPSLETKIGTVALAVRGAFFWDRTPEGMQFWHDFARTLEQ